MRHLAHRLTSVALFCVASGCAAFDGVAPRDIDLGGVAAGEVPDSSSLESFDRGRTDRQGESPGANEPVAVRRHQPPVALRNPRPDGPNMDVYKSSGCYASLKSVAADAAVSPRTRSLASQVLACDSVSGHYDLRHAPCPLFAAADDDRLVDTAIQELVLAAAACNAPPG